jgi:hypothetical protein
MRYRWIIAGMLLAAIGCNRQDAECLGRIGNLVAHKFGEMKPVVVNDSGLNRALPGNGAGDVKVNPDANNK